MSFGCRDLLCLNHRRIIPNISMTVCEVLMHLFKHRFFWSYVPSLNDPPTLPVKQRKRRLCYEQMSIKPNHTATEVKTRWRSPLHSPPAVHSPGPTKARYSLPDVCFNKALRYCVIWRSFLPYTSQPTVSSKSLMSPVTGCFMQSVPNKHQFEKKKPLFVRRCWRLRCYHGCRREISSWSRLLQVAKHGHSVFTR